MGGFAFLDRWRHRQAEAGGQGLSADDAGTLAEMLAECALLREQAETEGVQADDSPESLAALDQVLPAWRDDPEMSAALGHDAGLYLGTVIVRTIPGATWKLLQGGRPVVRLASGREVDVVEVGAGWAQDGAPELWQVYCEVDER